MPLTTATHDSLPYIDDIPPPSLTAARALITASLPPSFSPTSTPPHPSLPPLPPSTFTPLIEAELTRLTNDPSSTISAIDTARYELPSLSPPSSPSNNPNPNTPSQAALRTAYISHTYLTHRSAALTLLEQFGKNAWLVHNSQLEKILEDLEREFVEMKGMVEECNRERKRSQVGRGEELRGLEREWQERVGRCVEVQVALGER